jgi:hypothetical protein
MGMAWLWHQYRDLEAPFIKYRLLTDQLSHSPQYWNNIGMAFYRKEKSMAVRSNFKVRFYFCSSVIKNWIPSV